MNEYDAKITNIFPTPLFFPYIIYIVYIAEKVSRGCESIKMYLGKVSELSESMKMALC